HEWCAEGVEPQIDFLQKVPLSAITGIMEKITTVGAYCIDSLSEDLDTNSPEYQILEMQGIKSLLIVPLEDKGKIVGFLGVDDPVVHKSNLKVLQTVGIFVYDDLDKVKTSQKLEFLINCDKLTGLYNRNYYDTALAKIKESQLKSVGIVYIDINGLKIINTNYGHSFGDTYIVNCTQTLREHFEYDIFRISGDEFVIFLEDIDYKEFNKKVTMFEDVLKKNKQVSMSLGSSWCNNLEDIDKHIMAADTAMLKNKENHYRKIEDCMEFFQQTAEELLLEEINNSGFEVFLQPKIFLDTNKIIGAEALIRKKDELGNYIPPNLFIPRYEKQGTIFLIDLFVLRQVCELLSEAKNIGMSELPHISINFSRITLLTPEIHTKSLEICKQYNIESSMVTIEVTEDCGFVESAAIGHAIEKLKEIGFKISLDDFGCKYSNIEILSSVSFDEVK
ncbi:MAG: EAL domain-containing protein, partial [Anaerotignaceae bacterium]